MAEAGEGATHPLLRIEAREPVRLGRLAVVVRVVPTVLVPVVVRRSLLAHPRKVAVLARLVHRMDSARNVDYVDICVVDAVVNEPIVVRVPPDDKVWDLPPVEGSLCDEEEVLRICLEKLARLRQAKHERGQLVLARDFVLVFGDGAVDALADNQNARLDSPEHDIAVDHKERIDERLRVEDVRVRVAVEERRRFRRPECFLDMVVHAFNQRRAVRIFGELRRRYDARIARFLYPHIRLSEDGRRHLRREVRVRLDRIALNERLERILPIDHGCKNADEWPLERERGGRRRAAWPRGGGGGTVECRVHHRRWYRRRAEAKRPSTMRFALQQRVLRGAHGMEAS